MTTSRSYTVRILHLFLSLACVLFVNLSCNEPEPDFISGDCLSHSDETSINGIYSLYQDTPRANLEPYYCLAYEVIGDDSLKLELINYMGNCAGPMGGTSHLENSNSLTLKVKRQSDCGTAADCMCPYYMSMEVNGIDSTTDLDVVIENLECDGSLNNSHYAALPLKTKAKDFSCRYSWDVVSSGDQGGRCVGSGREECNANLSCVEVKETWTGSEKRCLTLCEQTSDCPTPSVQECREGLCQIANPLELDLN